MSTNMTGVNIKMRDDFKGALATAARQRADERMRDGEVSVSRGVSEYLREMAERDLRARKLWPAQNGRG